MTVCSPVQREALLKNCISMPSEYIQDTRALILGLDYAVRNYVDATSYNFIGNYDQSAGITATNWPNLVTATEAIEVPSATAYSQVYIVDALVNFYSDFSTAHGSKYSTFKNKIQNNSGVTIWHGSGFTTGVEVQVGDYVLLDDGAGHTLETTVAGFEASGTSGYDVLVLSDNTTSLGASFKIKVCEIATEVTVPIAKLTSTATQITIGTAVTVITERCSSATAVITGHTRTGGHYSRAYTSYRALRSGLTSAVSSVATEADIIDLFEGYTQPESVLGFAVYRAIAPTLTPELPNPPPVKLLAVASDDNTGWTAAINLVKRRNDWAYLAPLTNTESTLTLLMSMIATRAQSRLPSEMFFCRSTATSSTLYTGSAGSTVTIDQSYTTGENRTVYSGAGISPFASAQAGDIVTLHTQGSFVIESVISAQLVTSVTELTAGADYIETVVHNLTADEKATELGVYIQGIANRYLIPVFPDSPTWNGVAVNGYFLAAALAGARGYSAAHQSIRAMQLEDGWKTDQSFYDFSDEVDTIASYGATVVDNLEDGSASYVRNANTSDPSSTLNSRELHTANTVGVERFLYRIFACYEGRVKATSNTAVRMQAAGNDGMQMLAGSTKITDIEGAIAGGSVAQPYASSNQADEMVVPITYSINAGLEQLNVQVEASIATAG